VCPLFFVKQNLGELLVGGGCWGGGGGVWGVGVGGFWGGGPPLERSCLDLLGVDGPGWENALSPAFVSAFMQLFFGVLITQKTQPVVQSLGF